MKIKRRIKLIIFTSITLSILVTCATAITILENIKTSEPSNKSPSLQNNIERQNPESENLQIKNNSDEKTKDKNNTEILTDTDGNTSDNGNTSDSNEPLDNDPDETTENSGGGGGGGYSPPPPPDPPDDPYANAGINQTVTAGSIVQLNGTGSTGPPEIPLTYTWTQLEGTLVTLSDPYSATPNFTAPQIDTENVTVIWELTVTAGSQTDNDTVVITVTLYPLSWGTPPPGVRVWFLTGPKGASEPGQVEVTWTFVGSENISEVTLIQGCCGCNEQESANLTPDAQGVYHSMIDIPDNTTIWYIVQYTLAGIQYRGQSVYVNPPTGSGSAPSPPVIWYHYPSFNITVLQEVISSGVFTHVMITGGDRVVNEFNEADILQAVSMCQAAGIPVIWSRHLWNNWEDFQTIDDVFDPDFYASAIAQVQIEAAQLGVEFTALDCECYSGAPLYEYLHSTLSPSNFTRMSAAVEEAASRGQVDFVYPSGSQGNPLHPNSVYPPLGQLRIAESTYYDQPHKNCQITYEYDVFGAFVRPTTERPNNGLAPYFLPYDIFEKRFLWSQADGASQPVNGLFVYPGAWNDSEGALEIATMIANYFAE